MDVKTKTIKMHSANEVHQFVSKANNVQGDIIVRRGKFSIDGKSLLGILYINLNESCQVTYPANAYDFEKFILQFEVSNKA